MNTIKATTKYGGSAKEARDGFKINAVAQVTDEQKDVFASFGLASVLYRAGASAVNRELGVDNNSQCEFSDADARKIEKFLSAWAKGEDSPVEGGFNLVATLTRHVHGEGTTPKYFDEKKIVARHIEAKDIVTWASDVVGFNGEGDLDVENVEFLKAVKAYKTRMLASA